MASAQVKTAVLLAGLQAEGTTTVREPAPSRDHTERMLPVFGVPVERDGLAATVHGGASLRGTEILVPGDVSSAAFLVVAALVLPDSEIHLEGVLLSPTRAAFVDVLQAMGGDVEARLESTDPEPVGSIVARSSSLRGTTVDPARVAALIDEVPALAVAASFAEGTFTLTGAKELRVKESDRIAAMAEGLGRLGGRVRELPDGLVIEGRRPAPGGAGALPRGPPRRHGPGGGRPRRRGTHRDRGGGVRHRLLPRVLRLPRPGSGAWLRRPTRVVLVGFMGAGKSAVGARLAERLGYRFEDMDQRIEERTGRTIAALFEEQGEEAFREEERREAAALAQLDRPGGGRRRRRLRASPDAGAPAARAPSTVWLRCDLETLLGRIPDDGARPLAGNRAIMRALLAEREPSYRQADLAVDTSEGTPHEVADRIVDLIERRTAKERSIER